MSEDNGLHPFIIELPNRRSREVLGHGPVALESCVCDLADLARVEVHPLLPIELHVEAGNVLGLLHVDESIAYIALVLEVNWKIEEVELVQVIQVYSLFEETLRVLVGDVLDHQRGPGICQNEGWVYLELSNLASLVVPCLNPILFNRVWYLG